ncbi:MAG TPA: YbaB/EbfC family nucleoid-associated protein [Tepiditoga sp.]|nr:YbaB/EbfC family nucleoid-associated protein [Tepiditoga sp.]
MARKMKSLGGRSFKQGVSKKTDMSKVLAEAQKAQESMDAEMVSLESKLSEMTVEATSGGGVVKVIANANLKVKDIIISEELKDEEFEIVKDMIIAATNEAMEKASQLKEEESDKISQKYLSGLQGMVPGF